MIGPRIIPVVALSSLVLAVPQAAQVRNGNNNNWKNNIKNVVVLVEENRSFDTFAGGLTYNSAIDGLLHHNYCNSM
jgi:phospholipase C